MSYEMIDQFLRNNLNDDDYAEYSTALDSICTPPAVVHAVLVDSEPSAGEVLCEVEQAIRNGDCPWSIEQAFEKYETARKALVSADVGL